MLLVMSPSPKEADIEEIQRNGAVGVGIGQAVIGRRCNGNGPEITKKNQEWGAVICAVLLPGCYRSSHPYRLDRGSNACCNPSPMKLTAITVMKISNPG